MRVRAPGVGRAAQWIGVADLDDMFVNVIPMHMMQMTIVEVIDMAVMAHSCVSATRTMFMSVIRMMLLVAGGHGFARLWNLSGGLNMQREFDTMVCSLYDFATEHSGEKLRRIDRAINESGGRITPSAAATPSRSHS
jgi:hypothetical protein